ncbi:MAG: ABC transporter permease [Actinobacteria bacterium]|nr:ABC transporter permease [Actinomycetota bacterium]
MNRASTTCSPKQRDTDSKARSRDQSRRRTKPRSVDPPDTGDDQALDARDRPSAGNECAEHGLPDLLRRARRLVVRQDDEPAGIPRSRFVPPVLACCDRHPGRALRFDLGCGRTRHRHREQVLRSIAPRPIHTLGHRARPNRRQRVVRWPFGATIRGGVPAFLVMVASGGLVSLAIGALMSSVAIRTGSAEAVQGAFPLIFILLFFSSAFFPRETMSGTYRKIADINPISHLVEGLREMVLHQVTMGSIAKAILIPIAVCIAATMLALSALRARLAAL